MSDLTAGGASAPAPAAPAIDTAPPAVGATPETPAAPAAPVETKQPTIDETLSAAWDRAQTGSDRGDDGKFVSDKPKETTELAVQPTDKATEPAAPAIEPPNSWTAEAKAEVWPTLSPKAQELVLRRESESHKAITSQGERIKSYEPIERVITEYGDEFSRRSLSPEQGIRSLLQAQRMLDENPINGLVTIAGTYGIDLQALLSGQQGAIPQPDPVVGQLRQEITQLKGEVQKYTHEHRASQQAADVAAVKEFAKDKPYFDDVRVLMASLMKDGHAETLQSAYDMATKAHPSIGKRIEADQRKADEVKRKADEEAKQVELKKRAEEAAKSAKVNVRSGTAFATPKTMDDTLEEIARRHYG